MINYILTFTILIGLFLIILPIRLNKTVDDSFLSKDYTTVIKGVCSIIVILVHIPIMYQNKLQDGIGSFAYICVTLFFFISAYGMTVCLKKKDYLKNFWRNRLISLLIPCLLINILSIVVYSFLNIRTFKWLSLLYVNPYVVQLLVFCLVFYGVHCFFKQKSNEYVGGVKQDVIICTIILLISLSLFLLNYGWKTEFCGLIYGILLARYKNLVVKIFQYDYIKKVIIGGLASIMLGVIYLECKTVYFWGDYLIKIILGISIIAFSFCMSSHLKFGNIVSNYLGKISYEIYLLHGPVIIVLMYSNITISSGCFILLTVSLTVIFSIIINKLSNYITAYFRVD